MATRVLHVLPHRGGGAETYIDMLERLPGTVHERAYLSAGRTPASALVSVPVGWTRVAARARNTDLIHAHGDVASAIALPLLRTRPSLITAQGLHLLRRVDDKRGSCLAGALASVGSACRAVVCSSAGERDDLTRVMRTRDHQKLHLIYNAVDPASNATEAERMALRAELGVPADSVVGLFVGQLESRKNPLLAAQAAARLHAAGSPFVLVLAGDGPQAAALRGFSSDAVKVVGYRSDVSRLLAGADVFVHPSEREGMSFALLEAMSHGLAVVAADSSSNPEAVGDAGVLFAAGDEASLCEALANVSEPALRASLGGKAKARAGELFSPATFLARTEAVYQHARANSATPIQVAVA